MIQKFFKDIGETIFPTKNTLKNHEMRIFTNKEHDITFSTQQTINLSETQPKIGDFRTEMATAIDNIFDDVPTLESLIDGIDNLSLPPGIFRSGRTEFVIAIEHIFDDIPSSGTLESLINVIEPSFKLFEKLEVFVIIASNYFEPKTIDNMVLRYNNFQHVNELSTAGLFRSKALYLRENSRKVVELTINNNLTYRNKIFKFLSNFVKKISIEHQYILIDNG